MNQNVRNNARPQTRKRPPNGDNKIDVALLLIVIALVLFGIMMVYSSSYYVSAINLNDSTYYLRRQTMYAMLGFFAMYATSKFDYRLYNSQLPWIFYFISLALVIYAGLFGVASHGASRWIQIFGFTIQPSEFAKVSIILLTPYIIANNTKLLGSLSGHFKIMIPTLIMTVCVGIIIFVIGVGILFLASPRVFEFVALAISGAVMMVIYLIISSMLGQFRGARFKAWLNPFEYAQDYGFQIIQSLYAVASGGFFGLGLGKSRQKLSFIPEAHNDIIFAIICEELGFFGALVVLTLFVLFIWRVFAIALKCTNLFAALICSGFAIMVSAQVIINVAVVTNSIPNTGIPMPFISSGGSALIVAMALTGIILNISRSVDLD